MDIIVVDGNRGFREILKYFFNEIQGFDVVGDAENEKDLFSIAENHPTGIVIIGIENPDANGIEISRDLLRKYPELKILALSFFGNKRYWELLRGTGVKGYVLKSEIETHLMPAIQQLSKGETYYKEEVMHEG